MVGPPGLGLLIFLGLLIHGRSSKNGRGVAYIWGLLIFGTDFPPEFLLILYWKWLFFGLLIFGRRLKMAEGLLIFWVVYRGGLLIFGVFFSVYHLSLII